MHYTHFILITVRELSTHCIFLHSKKCVKSIQNNFLLSKVRKKNLLLFRFFLSNFIVNKLALHRISCACHFIPFFYLFQTVKNHFSHYREPLEVHYLVFYEINKHFDTTVGRFIRTCYRAIYRT